MISANRLWTLGAVIVAIGLAALGYFFGVAPQLAARSAAQLQLSSVQTSNDQLSAKVTALAAESRKLGTLQSQYDALNSALPASSATSDFVQQLGSAAASAGVTVSGISISDAQPYAAPTAPAPAASSTASSTAAPTPTATGAKAEGMPPFTSTQVTGSTMAVIPVTLQATGDYASVLRFVKAVQTMQRYFFISGISTSPGTGGTTAGSAAAPSGSVTASLTGDIFSITGQAASAASAAAG